MLARDAMQCEVTFFFMHFQLVINILLNEVGSEELQTGGLTSSLEAMIPYTERHFKRLTQLMQDLHLLVYTVNRTKPHNTVGIS